MSDRALLYRAVIAALAALVLGQALLLAGTEGPLLVTLSRGPAPPLAAASPLALTLPQVVEGLTRLDGAPELLLDRAQARRLVPVMPLVREALEEGRTTAGAPTVEHFGAMLLAYVQRTLTPAQAAHVQGLAARGELTSQPEELLDRLPQLDKALRQRAGLSLTETMAVRRSLELLRIRDVLLGILFLEEQKEVRLTRAQAELLLPMRSLIQESMNLQPGTVGKISLPLLEAQLRALLTEPQQQALVRIVDAKGLASVEVNIPLLLEQFASLLATRRKDGDFRFDFASILERQPMGASAREGPAVIPQRSDLDLPVAVRGIFLQLERDPALRLTDQQVEELAVMAPRVQQCLLNLMNRVMDDGIPEVEGRVSGLLTAEQLRYLREHQHDDIPMLEFSAGEEPVAKELGRFLEARKAGTPYQPSVHKAGGINPSAPGAQPEPSPSAALQTQTVAVAGPRPAPSGPPLEAIVRGILFGLEKVPALRLEPSQVARLEGLAPRLRAQLDEIQAGRRGDESLLLQGELVSFLSEKQREAVYRSAGEPPLPLHASTGESPLAREVGRFLEARRAGRAYEPLSIPEAP